MAAKPSGLGRGLGALIKDAAATVPTAAPPPPREAPAKAGPLRVPVSEVRPSPWQPRRVFDEAALAELVESVRARGVLQPLLVRRAAGRYELIAGERRFRAAQAAGLSEVPVQLLEVSDREALELALIENLQREDLNLIEEAEGYRALAAKFNLTQEEVAERVGKARPTVANALRLLELPDAVKQLVAEQRITPGHAKALLAIPTAPEQELLARRIAAEGLSVRQVEKLAAAVARPHRARRVVKSDIPLEHQQYVLDRLHQKLGTSVRLVPTRQLPNGRRIKGTLEIDYFTPDELDRILVILGVAGDL